MAERQPIPNINIGQVYDQRYADADVHCESLGRLAGFFGRNMPVHRHDRFFQVHYVRSGLVRLYLDDQFYSQPGPMFFLTPPTFPHAFVTDSGSEGYVLTVRQQLVWPLLDSAIGLAPGPQIAPMCVALAGLEEEVARLERLFAELQHELESEAAARAAALEALTRLLLIQLLRQSAGSQQAQPGRREEMQVFQRFNALIEQHYREHWPLALYAGRLGVTEARLNDICRRVAGLPSKRLVFDRLMQEARRLLLFSSQSVSEICYELGFKDPAYFSRFFTRNAGLTPGDYRLQQRQAGEGSGL